MIYFDSAATTKPLDVAINSFIETERKFYYNTSSLHSAGRECARLLEGYRNDIASLLKIDTDKYNIIFTSSASESNAIVIQSILKKNTKSNIVISNSEHKSIESFSPFLKQKGYKVSCSNVKKGYVDFDNFISLLDENTYLASCIHTNNVTGYVNDIFSLADRVKIYSKNILFHSDVTQSVATGICDFSKSDAVDSYSFSSHKCYAPKGLGVLVIKKGIIPSLSSQGGQEFGIRGGTHALGLISALYSSLSYIVRNKNEIKNAISNLHSYAKEELEKINGVFVFFEKDKQKSDSILLFSQNKFPTEVFQRILSDRGFALGAGAACSSNSKNSSVLNNYGYSDELTKGALRISFSIYNTKKEVDELLLCIRDVLK